MRFFVLGRRTFLYITLLVCICVAATVLTGRLGSAVYVGAKQREVPIYSVETEGKRAALGFNCAWSDEDVTLLLTTLEENKVKATFFVVGEWVEKYPESVRAIAQAGHELGNHSYSHPDMTRLTREEMVTQITRCNEVVKEITGVSPALFRAPSGAYNNTVIETVRALGCHAIQWNVDSRDWQNPSPERIVASVTEHISAGSILLFHVGKENTDKALPELLRALQERGYELCTVSELMHKGEYTVDAAGRQHSARDF